MSFTVGLDFGTHQTKVCIENASNPAQKIYEFFEFDDLNGVKSVLLPSVVQINNDETVSYGFVDEMHCKTIALSGKQKPTLILPAEPKLELPEKPVLLSYPPKLEKQKLSGFSIKDQFEFLKRVFTYGKYYKKQCKLIDDENKMKIDEWEQHCLSIKSGFNQKLQEHAIEIQKLANEFNSPVKKWEIEERPGNLVFRHFKLATFSNQKWYFEISPELISTWYLTYVLFKVQEKYGDDFFTQMGVPYSIESSESEKQIRIAYKILIAANKLIIKYKTLYNFLGAKIQQLLGDTRLEEYTSQDISVFGLNVLPEAFAGLVSITQQGKLSTGMHLLIDIGGGTTDIAFFTISNYKLPNIHAVISFPQGLNFIIENMNHNGSITIHEIIELFRKNSTGCMEAITSYHKCLFWNTDQMLNRIFKEFENRYSVHRLKSSKLYEALKDRPLIYCGGGSMFNGMRIPLKYFTDKKLIDKELLNIPFVKNHFNDHSLFPILATSYGLSIQLERNIITTKIENVFDHLPQKEDSYKDWRNEYGLSDT